MSLLQGVRPLVMTAVLAVAGAPPAPPVVAAAPPATPAAETARQQAPPTAPAPGPDSDNSTPAPPATPTPAPQPPPPRSREAVPTLDIYFPDGELDLRLGRLIRNTFFEGQMRYNFVKADISAFLRYRYYGYRRSYTLGVFDSIEFENVEKLNNDFERVRGADFLVELPRTYHQRAFLLAETDRLTSNKDALRFNNDRTNTFLRLSYQIGTPNDARSNSIVGETRAREQRLFTAPRKIGPRGAGLTAALSFASDALGDFDYLRAEVEALKRFDLGPRTFLITRLHQGSFLSSKVVRTGPDLPPEDRLSIPRNELFRLDGRDNLKGVGERLQGTEELHATLEVFVPWFLDESRRALWLDWKSWYWVVYGGVGTVGFDRSIYTDGGSYIPDIGLGAEASFRVRGFSLFVAGIVAHALDNEGGFEAQMSIKSYR